MDAKDIKVPFLAALTFDDGPNTGTTVQVLDLLEEHQIKASFFVIGENITEETRDVVARAFHMGCDIENHSWTHPVMSELDAEAIREEVGMTSGVIHEITGRWPEYFRPPYIAVGPLMYENISLPFICGYGANDWEDEVSAQERADRILAQAEDGAILLLHDMEDNFQTVDALRIIIPELKKRGYEFVTVSELFRRKQIQPLAETDVIYTVVRSEKESGDLKQ